MKPSTWIRVLAVGLGLLVPVVSHAGKPTLEEVLSEHCRARAAVVTLRAQFTQTKVFKLFDEEEVSKGVVYFAQPNRICWQYSEPDNSSTVISGNAGWSVFPDIEQVQKFQLEGSQANKVLSIVGFGPCGAPLTESFEIELGEVRKGTIALDMIPTDAAIRPYFSRVDLTLDRSDYLPREIELLEKSGDVLIFRFSNLDQEIKLDQTIFDYAVPEGYSVVEY
jgi:outer membrane lipoprotein-sorting protein